MNTKPVVALLLMSLGTLAAAGDIDWRVEAKADADGIDLLIAYRDANKPFQYAVGLRARHHGRRQLPLRRLVQNPETLLAMQPIFLRASRDSPFNYKCCANADQPYLLYVFSADQAIKGLSAARIWPASNYQLPPKDGKRRLLLRGGTQHHGALTLRQPAHDGGPIPATSLAVDPVGCDSGASIDICAFRLDQ